MQKGSTDYQLVTWSRDRKLFIWKVDPQMQRLCGAMSDLMESSSSMDLDALSTPPLSVSGGTATPTHGSFPNGHSFGGDPSIADMMAGFTPSPEEPSSVSSLEQELDMLSIPVRDVMVDKIDRVKRNLLLICSIGRNLTELRINFPDLYPLKTIPSFSIVSSNCICDTVTKKRLIESLEEVCLCQLDNGKPCIEACIKQLSALMGGIILSGHSGNISVSQNKPIVSSVRHTYGGKNDTNIPFPKTCGARFCGVDKLVVFSRPSHLKKNVVSFNNSTPKALSALSASSITSEVPSLGIYYKDKERKQKRTARHRRKSSDHIVNQSSSSISRSSLDLCDVSLLLPIHRQLAESYKILPNDIPLMCTLNATAATSVGRSDLAQTWSMVALACTPDLAPSSIPEDTPWAHHPFGRNLILSLFEHYCNIHDVQTLAMLCCIFKPYLLTHNIMDDQMDKDYLLTDETDTLFRRQWSSSSLSSIVNINSEEAEDDYKFNEQRDPTEEEEEQHHDNKQLLDPSRAKQYDQFLLSYAEILFQWKLLDERAQVLQRLSNPNFPVKNMLHFTELVVICYNCHKRSMSNFCDSCRRIKFQCSICHLMVKGSSSFCLSCGHGGHVTHMMDWFQKETLCPTGCRCECEVKTKVLLENSISITPHGFR